MISSTRYPYNSTRASRNISALAWICMRGGDDGRGALMPHTQEELLDVSCILVGNVQSLLLVVVEYCNDQCPSEGIAMTYCGGGPSWAGIKRLHVVDRRLRRDGEEGGGASRRGRGGEGAATC